ncbi:hypothetical protein LXA43DRAFT_1094516 [Ganoderma leucocontextum]|nr:hypothetical protein LXA43DRAFT_1094516 [Ganoderma leucocontextum]
MRPEPPQSRIWSQQLKTEILYQCWHHSPTVRPSFAKVEHDVQELWAHYGPDLKESSAPLVWETEDMAVAIPPGSPHLDDSYRYSSPLQRGHKTAHLITESTNYRYLEDLSTPKRWFQDNADRILGIYGEEHCISKEDLYLGTSFVPFAIS